MNPVLKILKIFLVWRIVLFVPVVLGSWLLVYGSSYPFFEITYYKVLPEILDDPVLTVWSNFDGVHYLKIVADGYQTEARFFPLLPALIYFLSMGNIFFGLTFLIALILPNIFLLLALIVFYKLLRLDYPADISLDAIIYLLVFPAAFFLAMIYTEGLFLLLVLGSLYFARKGNWLFAVIAATLLCTTRFVGLFIIPALIYEYFIQNKTIKLQNILRMTAIIFIIPLGLVSYSIYSLQKWGSPIYFLTAHTELGNDRSAANLVLPPQTLYRYFKILTNLPITQFEWWLALLEAAAFIFGCAMLYIAWRKKVRISYLIFSLLAFLLPVLSGTFSGLPRYVLILFPVFIVMALIKSKFIGLAYSVLSIVLLVILLMFFSRGYFIA